MVLGMIVDNSIIVVDAYLETWTKGCRAGTRPSRALKLFRIDLSGHALHLHHLFPLLVTMTGQFRDFLNDFPWTVTISLMVSLVLAMVFIPFLEYVLIKRG